jgi:hypothetical protein
MRILYLPTIIYIVLFITACATPSNHPPVVVSTETTTVTPECHGSKDPLAVSMLTISKPDRPYQVVGKAIVSRYNIAGIKRQEATIRDILRELAASLNGDALIDFKNDGKTITATVIAYKQALV